MLQLVVSFECGCFFVCCFSVWLTDNSFLYFVCHIQFKISSDEKFAATDYDQNQYPPHPLFLLETTMRRKIQTLQTLQKKRVPDKTSLNDEEADEIAKKTCGCNLCPRSDQSKQGGVSFDGPFSDPIGKKDLWTHKSKGTLKNPFNHRTDLPAPRGRI